MRLLFLTNFYPPYEIGGQERSCLQVVQCLRQRGHETLVLTSTHGSGRCIDAAENIHRTLHLEMDMRPWRHSLEFFTKRKKREKHNLDSLAATIKDYQPDLIFMWGMWNFPRSLPVLAEELMPGRVVYRFAEYWPTLPSQHEMYWQTTGRRWFSRLLKDSFGRVALAMLAREKRDLPLQFKHAVCVSEATRDKLVASGVPVAGAEIIYTGLDIKVFPGRAGTIRADGSLRLLYAGRLAKEKGVETAILAVAALNDSGQAPRISLTLAGTGLEAYTRQLNELVNQHGLEQHVSFLGWVPNEKMPELMRQHDVLLVPSIWPEPFARVVLEGMAAGLIIVATPAGGTQEIVIDGHNGLLFPPGDSEALAAAIRLLFDDPHLGQRLAAAGRRTVVQDYTLEGMIDRYEAFLKSILRVDTLISESLSLT